MSFNPMIFHPSRNNGREVTINGNVESVVSVSADGQSFRIQSEVNGPVVHDYTIRDIQMAKVLTVSFNGGTSWMDVPVTQA